jgi:hypothetical protein
MVGILSHFLCPPGGKQDSGEKAYGEHKPVTPDSERTDGKNDRMHGISFKIRDGSH